VKGKLCEMNEHKRPEVLLTLELDFRKPAHSHSQQIFMEFLPIGSGNSAVQDKNPALMGTMFYSSGKN
jgi:hypothetical protein